MNSEFTIGMLTSSIQDSIGRAQKNMQDAEAYGKLLRNDRVRNTMQQIEARALSLCENAWSTLRIGYDGLPELKVILRSEPEYFDLLIDSPDLYVNDEGLEAYDTLTLRDEEHDGDAIANVKLEWKCKMPEDTRDLLRSMGKIVREESSYEALVC